MVDPIVQIVEKNVYEKGQEVSGVVRAFTPLGVNFVIDGKHHALAYKNEIFQHLEIGQQVDVYIKTIREDGQIDVSLQQPNFRDNLSTSTDVVLSKLIQSGGNLPYGDKSSPEDIYRVFGMSKRVFKQAIGVLYKRKKIILSDRSIKQV